MDALTVRSGQILPLGVGLGVTHQLLNDSGLKSEGGRVADKMEQRAEHLWEQVKQMRVLARRELADWEKLKEVLEGWDTENGKKRRSRTWRQCFSSQRVGRTELQTRLGTQSPARQPRAPRFTRKSPVPCGSQLDVQEPPRHRVSLYGHFHSYDSARENQVGVS